MPPFRTHVPGPAPAGGGALNVSGSQASIKLTMTLPDAFIRWLTVVASASVGFEVMLEGVVSDDEVLDGLPGPQPNSTSASARRTKRKGINWLLSTPPHANVLPSSGTKSTADFERSIGDCGESRFSILELNGESRIQLNNTSSFSDRGRRPLKTHRARARARGDDCRDNTGGDPVARDARRCLHHVSICAPPGRRVWIRRMEPHRRARRRVLVAAVDAAARGRRAARRRC